MTKAVENLESVLSGAGKKRGGFLRKYLNYAANLGRDAVLLHDPQFTENFAVNGSIALGLLEGVAYWAAVSAVTNSVVGTLFSAILIPTIGYLRGVQAEYAIKKFERLERAKAEEPEGKTVISETYSKPVGLFARYGS